MAEPHATSALMVEPLAAEKTAVAVLGDPVEACAAERKPTLWKEGSAQVRKIPGSQVVVVAAEYLVASVVCPQS